MSVRSSVTPEKKFRYGIHKPGYIASNLRHHTSICTLGHDSSGAPYSNARNYPDQDVEVEGADWIFEIPNPLAFRGSTYIDKEWADSSASNPKRIALPKKELLSLSALLDNEAISPSLFAKLPAPLHLTLATSSTDPEDLIRLASLCCQLEFDSDGTPCGLLYEKNKHDQIRAKIHNHALFEAVANNPVLPDSYKQVMVLRPGVQGGSEIVGEYGGDEEKTHVYEYLRRNSYIAGGHYAANMGDHAIRYSITELSELDMNGLRHLYYQRTFVRLAQTLDMQIPLKDTYSPGSLEDLRGEILAHLTQGPKLDTTATLWGWNFGFDYAASGYRLHASHQQIHQQYSMLPQEVDSYSGSLSHTDGPMDTFGCGDMVAEVMQAYREHHCSEFFADYLGCIRNNMRMDERGDLDSSLILWEDAHAILFVPKAQTSQYELQLMALCDSEGEIIGNILEADTESRLSLNRGIFLAQKALAGLGARMVTSIEYPKRMGVSGEPGQHLLHSFLPRLPESPGAFSEAQLRYINGHYPEDFAAVCRRQLTGL